MHGKARELMIKMAGVKLPARAASPHAGNAPGVLPAEPMCSVVARSVEVGVVVPSILLGNMDLAGYKVEYVQKQKGVECFVKHRLDCLLMSAHRDAVDYFEANTRDPQAQPPDGSTMLIVGRGYSFDKADALLQAVFAEMKEEMKEHDEGEKTK